MRSSFLLLATVLLLQACSKGDIPYVERPVGSIYNQAMDAFEKGRYVKAAPLFEEVERQHPYSTWAAKAQLMAAYSYYAEDKYDNAIDILTKYIQLRPGSSDTPYAHYLKGLSYYERISDVGRDQKMTELSRAAFEELIQRFPDTGYAKDARLKIDLTNDHLAGKEMEIGRFYLNRNQHVAAIGRFNEVVEHHQSTSHIEEALYRLTEIYVTLGVKHEASRYTAILQHNYPKSVWYQYAYQLLVNNKIDPSLEPQAWWKKPFSKIF
jgi:outer membrane protein assembly factor BamD